MKKEIQKRNLREGLLRVGMGLFVFAMGATALNVILLPIAREYFGYGTAITLITLAVYASGMLFLGRRLLAAREEKLERAVKIGVPVYLAVLFAVQLVMAYCLEYTPSGDNFMLYNAAQLLSTDGNFDAYPDFYLYLSRFSNQWGFLLMLSALYKLLFAVGMTELFFPTAVVQALLYIAGMAAFFAIARRLRGVRGTAAALVIAATCFPLYLAASVLYTDTFSLPFVMLSLLFALRAKDADSIKGMLLNALACAAFAAVGGQIKMTAAIILIAATIIFILRMKPLRALCACAVIWGVMGLSVVGTQKIIVGPVLDPDMVAQHNTPTIHWIMMSIPTGNNPYGNDIEDYRQTWTMMEEGASHEEVMDSIYTRMIDKIYFLRLPSRLIPGVLRKNAAAFGDGTFGLSEILDDRPVRSTPVSSVVIGGGRFYEIYSAICSGIFFAHMIFAVLACLRDMKRRDDRAAMLYVAMFGFMLFMLLWEARSRYIFNFVPVLLLLSMGFVVRGAKEGECET